MEVNVYLFKNSMRSMSYFQEKEVGSITSILWENLMLQFGISFWQKKRKWKYFDTVHLGTYLLKYLHIGIHLLPFVRKKSWRFWNKFLTKGRI